MPFFVDTNGLKYTVLKQRTGKGIWQNLWEFPLIESDNEIDIEAIKKRYSEILELKGQPTITLFNSDSVVHKLSHQHLFTKFWIIEIDDLITNAVPVSELGKYPVPVLISTFMNAFKF